MKFEIPLFTGLLFLATQLLMRAQMQGFEAALLSSAAEMMVRGWRAARKQRRWTGRDGQG
ncbi:MAG TPA: hypothetical protein VJQ55_03910 [Candidatus Binatia bacterium]|nr:hypothetical protein [Candidatus Binatia bacterium]